jgi:adenine-specific DNA-methyltransferase
MMYPRLFLARQLLRDDGVMFVSIDDHEVHNLRLLMNEIFGEENFVAAFIWQKRYSRDNRPTVGAVHDYVLLYARQAEQFAETRGLLKPDEDAVAVYRNPNNNPRGRWRGIPMTAQAGHAVASQFYEIEGPDGTIHKPPEGRCWSLSEPEFRRMLAAGRIWFGKDGSGQPNVIRYLSEVEGFVPWTWWPHTEVGHTDEAKKEAHAYFGKLLPFETPKPVRLLRRMLEIGAPEEDALVLDFFAGSGTTAEAVLRSNREIGGQRRFVCVQLPEPTENADFPTLADMAKHRIRQVIKALGAETRTQLDGLSTNGPADLGLRVFKLAPSNFRQWEPVDPEDPHRLIEQMGLFVDPLIDGWQPEPVVWEVAVKEGYALHSRVERLHDIAQNTVYRVTDPDKVQSFLICVDQELQEATVRALRLSADDLFVCRDVALTDTLAANLALQCRLKTI